MPRVPHRRPIRQTSSFCDPAPSRVHSAHIGQEVDVHYRWHPLYGRRLRVQRSEQRANGLVVYLEVALGIVMVLPGWMVDASACAGMALGAPRISIDALQQLHLLLSERGYRRSFCDDLSVIQENRKEQTAPDPKRTCAAPCRAAPEESCLRVERPSRPVHGRANEGPDEPNPSVTAGGWSCRGERQ